MKILQKRKKVYIQSLEGTKFDLIEHGGGDAEEIEIGPSNLNKALNELR